MSGLTEVVAAGGRVWTEGERLRYRVPEGRPDLVKALRAEVPMLRACERICRESGGDVLALAAQIEDAYRRLKIALVEAPRRRFACEVLDAEADPVLVAVSVRGAGCAVVRMPRTKYDEAQLLEIMHRLNTESP